MQWQLGRPFMHSLKYGLLVFLKNVSVEYKHGMLAQLYMMASWHGNAFHITDHLWRKSNDALSHSTSICCIKIFLGNAIVRTIHGTTPFSTIMPRKSDGLKEFGDVTCWVLSHCHIKRWLTLKWTFYGTMDQRSYEDLYTRSRYQGQGLVITSHSICGM